MKIAEQKNAIANHIAQLLSEHSGIKIDESSGVLKIRDDLGLDSFSLVEILYELEIKYGLKVSNEALKNIISVKDVTDLLEKGI